MGINLFADGQYTTAYEGFPLFKNRVREALGFSTLANYQVPVALNSSGWPTANFQVILYAGIQQSWGVGNYSCGFVGSGNETIAAVNNATISNVRPGTGGAYTTFTLTSTVAAGSASDYGFSLSGVTEPVTNIYCYLPEYNGLDGIDDPASPSAFTTEAVSFYRQFGWLRLMWYSNALYNTTQMTSSNRSTPSNTQTQTSGIGASTVYPLTEDPGSTSATLASPWVGATGNYGVIFSTSSGNQARSVTITKGSTGLSWANPLVGGNAATATIGGEGPPIEWMIALANATGTTGLWINLPAWEDGSDGQPGSYSTAILQLLASSYTSTGKVFFERGNENFWNNYLCTPVLKNLEATGEGGYADVYDYMAAGAHAFANLARSNLPAGWWGSKVFQVEGQQAAAGNGPYYTGDYLGYLKTRSGGSPSSDVQYISIAPYVNPVVGATDSIASIELNVDSWVVDGASSWGAEQTDIVARTFGLTNGLVSYEGGIQWNICESSGTSCSSTNSSEGAAIMDVGMTAPITNVYQQYANLGFQAYTHFASGVWVSPSNEHLGSVNELTTSYSSLLLSGSPTLAGIQPFETGQTVSRNVVGVSGATISGSNYADNLGNTNDCSFANTNVQAPVPNISFFAPGNCFYRVWNPNPTSHTYTLIATFAGVSGSPRTNLIVNGTTQATAVAVSNGAITVGSVTLAPGDNFVVLGIGATQSASIEQLQFN